MSEDAKLVRVNIRISTDLNTWLDKQSAETGLSKSTMIMLATENYRQQKEAMTTMANMGVIMKQLEVMNKQLEAMEKKIEK